MRGAGPTATCRLLSANGHQSGQETPGSRGHGGRAGPNAVALGTVKAAWGDAGGAKVPRPESKGRARCRLQEGRRSGGRGALTLLTWPARSKLAASRKEKTCSMGTSGSGTCTSTSISIATSISWPSRGRLPPPPQAALHLTALRPGRVPTCRRAELEGTGCRCTSPASAPPAEGGLWLRAAPHPLFSMDAAFPGTAAAAKPRFA